MGPFDFIKAINDSKNVMKTTPEKKKQKYTNQLPLDYETK